MKNSNRLINEKNPYLLQHANNPVDWFPWCDEAFEKAKKEDKPIFLSIGYSTCHWCHVMERESFEDEDVAKLMNDAFVSIKVDREERPDIDGVYMSVCQLMTGSGGWPLTIIMTPDKKPFFAGTYFPKTTRSKRIGMLELIPKIKEVWINKRDDILKSSEEISAALQKEAQVETEVELNDEIFETAYINFNCRFDSEFGGFGNAPKFPSPQNLIFLLRHYFFTKEKSSLEMVTKTLTQLRLGGIYDHIGFGFSRYSTDREWLVPHFEKMLYDQAMLCIAYTEAFQITKNKLFKKTAEEIIEYVLRDMKHPEGGFFSAEDADSEGVEGKFYVWTVEEIREVLEKYADRFIKIFTVENDGNLPDGEAGWIDESKGIMNGTNILHLKEEIDSTDSDKINFIESCRKKLFEFREKRIHPYKDDKILTDWNGLMISALAKAAGVFDNHEFRIAAENATEFILSKLIDNKGELLHRFKDGDSAIEANLDDYTFIIAASLDLFELTQNPKYLKKTIELNDILVKKFLDKNGGFFFTSDTAEKLIVRKKELYDGAYPSGNSVQLLNLIRMSKFTGNTEYEEIADRMMKFFSAQVKNHPFAYTQFLTGLTFLLNKSYEIIINGISSNTDVQNAIKYFQKSYIPNKILLFNSNDAELLKLAPFLSQFRNIDKQLTINICQNFECKLPVNTINEAMELIDYI